MICLMRREGFGRGKNSRCRDERDQGPVHRIIQGLGRGERQRKTRRSPDMAARMKDITKRRSECLEWSSLVHH
jgi:hypothetical protein